MIWAETTPSHLLGALADMVTDGTIQEFSWTLFKGKYVNASAIDHNHKKAVILEIPSDIRDGVFEVWADDDHLRDVVALRIHES